MRYCEELIWPGMQCNLPAGHSGACIHSTQRQAETTVTTTCLCGKRLEVAHAGRTGGEPHNQPADCITYLKQQLEEVNMRLARIESELGIERH